MAIYPLNAATDGLLPVRNPLTVGTRGLLLGSGVIITTTPEDKIVYKGGGRQEKVKYTKRRIVESKELSDRLKRQLFIEEEEIIIIIKTFLECQ